MSGSSSWPIVKAEDLVKRARAATGAIELCEVRVDGDLDLGGHTFAGDVTLRRCIFLGRVTVCHARFAGLVRVEDVEFASDLDVRSAMFDSDVEADRVVLAAGAMKAFGNVVVAGDFIAGNVLCPPGKTRPESRAPLSFNSGQFKQSLWLHITADAPLDLIGVSTVGSLTIDAGSSINDRVQGDGAKVGGSLWIRGVTFGGVVTLISVIVTRQCYMASTRFDANVSCNGMTVAGLLIANRLDCRARARFINMSVSHPTDFRRGTFAADVELDGSSFSGDFMASGSVFKGRLLATGVKFGAATHFGACKDREVSNPGWWEDSEPPHWTQGAHFDSDACFADTTFQTSANFGGAAPPIDANEEGLPEWDGDGARCAGLLSFVGCQFGGALELDFLAASHLSLDWCTVPRRLSLEHVVGLAHLSVTRTTTDHIAFPPTLTPEHPSTIATVDLEGSTFTTADGDVEAVMAKLPFEWPAAIHTLEQAVRSAGDLKRADSLAIKEKHKELQRLRAQHNWVRLVWSRLYWLVARWGLRPYQLLFVLLLPLYGIAIFHAAGAVSRPPSALTPSAAGGTTTTTAVHLNVGDAAIESFDQFLPIDLARSNGNTPAGKSVPLTPLSHPKIPADLYATILNVAGWLLVPLGVAVIAGALRRQTKA